MKKCSALIFLSYAFALLTAERVAAGPITWEFIATACIGPVSQHGESGCDPNQSYPLTLASLALSGPDSAGSAVFLPLVSSAPMLTGDPFDFELTDRASVSTDHPLGTGRGGLFGTIVDYDISWSEVAGVLNSVAVTIDTEVDSIQHLRLTGGQVGSDFRIAGCIFTTCEISGFWINASLVTASEPGSLALLASAFGMLGLIRRRRNATCLRQLALSGSAVSERQRAEQRFSGPPARDRLETNQPRVPTVLADVDLIWCGRGDLNSHVLTDNRF